MTTLEQLKAVKELVGTPERWEKWNCEMNANRENVFAPTTTYADIIALLDRAIEAEEKKENVHG